MWVKYPHTPLSQKLPTMLCGYLLQKAGLEVKTSPAAAVWNEGKKHMKFPFLSHHQENALNLFSSSCFIPVTCGFVGASKWYLVEMGATGSLCWFYTLWAHSTLET